MMEHASEDNKIKVETWVSKFQNKFANSSDVEQTEIRNQLRITLSAWGLDPLLFKKQTATNTAFRMLAAANIAE